MLMVLYEELCVEKEDVRTLDGAELDNCAPETCILVEVCAEKEKGRTLYGLEQVNKELAINHAKNCAPDIYIMNISDGMMEIDKPVNVVGDLTYVNGTELEELCVLKGKFRTLDGTRLNCYARDCAPKTCIVERSDKMMKIENSENVDDPKRDRQWIVDDAATEYEELRVKKQKVESLDGVELDCYETDHFKTHAPKSIDGVEVSRPKWP
ncbi:hypothetical protein CQW23_24453 [Capsicum baccatum]|uniref:Uncharacterized protein n=1 Tax=Capsicum baccatum TaxID=33114 RepID=A0A2G2VUY2_CAPBA|nr:hypothetical protein CQW23_24453 [Capsicum baccatum]